MMLRSIWSGRGRRGMVSGAAAVLFWTAMGIAGAAPPRYTFTDLGTLGGYQSDAYAINDDGTVVGSAGIPDTRIPPMNDASLQRPFKYADGVMTQLNPFGDYGFATAINASGVIVGREETRSFTYDAAGFTLLPPTMPFAKGVNGSGDIVGSNWSGLGPDESREFTTLYSQGQLTRISNLGATAINDSGVISGHRAYRPISSGPSYWRAVTYAGGTFTTLGTLGGDDSLATGLNNNGTVVGFSSTTGSLDQVGTQPRAFIYRNGQMSALPVISGYDECSASGLNEADDVVGSSFDRYGGKGFAATLWRDGQAFRLVDLAVDFQGVAIRSATDINNLGQIVGQAIVESGSGITAFLMTPLPDRPAGAGQSTWATDGSGSWGTITRGYGVNWGAGQGSPGLDPGFKATDTATFGSAVTSGTAIVSLDGASPNLAGIVFDDAAASYRIVTGSRGRITLDNGSNPATINVVNGSHEIAATITGGTGTTIAKTGNGLLLLSGSNDYTGGTDVVAGTLVAGSLRAFGIGTVTVEAGATLDVTGQLITNAIVNRGGTLIGVSTVSGEIAGGQTFNEVTLADNAVLTSGTTIFAAPVSGDVTIRFDAAVAFADALNASVSVQGQATIAGPVGDSAAITVDSAGIVTFTDGASYAGSAIANDGTIVVDTSSSFLLAAGISGDGGLSMIGTGLFELEGVNTFAGPTFVDLGTLLVNGQLTESDVTVAADGTLGGSGSINGDVFVEGTLSPGNSPGLLSVGSLTLGGTSDTVMQISGTTRGLQYDAIDVSGMTVLGGALLFDITAALSGTTAFELFHLGGGATGHFADVSAQGTFGSLSFTRSDSLWSATAASGSILSFDESTGTLAIIAVPEPSTWTLLVAGVSAIAWRVRSGRRRSAA